MLEQIDIRNPGVLFSRYYFANFSHFQGKKTNHQRHVFIFLRKFINATLRYNPILSDILLSVSTENLRSGHPHTLGIRIVRIPHSFGIHVQRNTLSIQRTNTGIGSAFPHSQVKTNLDSLCHSCQLTFNRSGYWHSSSVKMPPFNHNLQRDKYLIRNIKHTCRGKIFRKITCTLSFEMPGK